ncbi:hypothetical protein N7468_002333 [Penicillium chermesinum]|uniref:Zn(2)-C6 fungal-type domain-containing protein n=1 Tax=Penicillium chermesinum TaxID=63820 RepID=A0A9W9PIF2_9EURO|nr:uncharacterized protein N7468_002333 [Penicillium chermesinum]KAJ5247350.1 hypothetical protein N7468_002333 [Penicillium chermesinum]
MTTFTDTGWPGSEPVRKTTQTKKRARQTGTAWTRSGCLTCKRRRKACDKAKPSCRNCTKQGRTCEGYGSLWVEPLGPSAHIFTPAELSKRRSGLSPHTGLLSPSLSPHPDNKIPPRVQTPKSDAPEEDSNEEISLAVIQRPRNYVPHLSDHELHYLQYHVEEGSKLLANLESDDNPLRSLLIPRAMSSPLLMKAICAVSALHLANRSQTFSALTASANFYGRTLAGLRAALNDSTQGSLTDDAMLAVGLMCKYEIVRGSVKQWGVHLSALQRMIASRGGLRTMDPDAGQFLRGLYLYAYNMARLSNRKRITAAEPNPTDTDLGAPRLDIYIGYTEEILKLCGAIADLPSLKGDDIALRLAIASINGALLAWSHDSTSYIIPQSLTPASLTRLQLVAECFRDAAFIYLHSVLEWLAIKVLGQASSLQMTDWSSLVSIPKSMAVQRCLARVETFPLDDHCEYSALTFPLFISGCENETIGHRDLVLRCLGKLQVNFGIGNVRRAKELLGILWARQDASAQHEVGSPVHWLDILDELQWDLILA